MINLDDLRALGELQAPRKSLDSMLSTVSDHEAVLAKKIEMLPSDDPTRGRHHQAIERRDRHLWQFRHHVLAGHPLLILLTPRLQKIRRMSAGILVHDVA